MTKTIKRDRIISAGRGLASEPSPVGLTAFERAALRKALQTIVEPSDKLRAITNYSATLDRMVAKVGLEAVAASLATICRQRSDAWRMTDGPLSRAWGRAAVKASALAQLGVIVGGKR